MAKPIRNSEYQVALLREGNVLEEYVRPIPSQIADVSQFYSFITRNTSQFGKTFRPVDVSFLEDGTSLFIYEGSYSRNASVLINQFQRTENMHLMFVDRYKGDMNVKSIEMYTCNGFKLKYEFQKLYGDNFRYRLGMSEEEILVNIVDKLRELLVLLNKESKKHNAKNRPKELSHFRSLTLEVGRHFEEGETPVLSLLQIRPKSMEWTLECDLRGGGNTWQLMATENSKGKYSTWWKEMF